MKKMQTLLFLLAVSFIAGCNKDDEKAPEIAPSTSGGGGGGGDNGNASGSGGAPEVVTGNPAKVRTLVNFEPGTPKDIVDLFSAYESYPFMMVFFTDELLSIKALNLIEELPEWLARDGVVPTMTNFNATEIARNQNHVIRMVAPLNYMQYQGGFSLCQKHQVFCQIMPIQQLESTTTTTLNTVDLRPLEFNGQTIPPFSSLVTIAKGQDEISQLDFTNLNSKLIGEDGVALYRPDQTLLPYYGRHEDYEKNPLYIQIEELAKKLMSTRYFNNTFAFDVENNQSIENLPLKLILRYYASQTQKWLMWSRDVKQTGILPEGIEHFPDIKSVFAGISVSGTLWGKIEYPMGVPPIMKKYIIQGLEETKGFTQNQFVYAQGNTLYYLLPSPPLMYVRSHHLLKDYDYNKFYDEGLVVEIPVKDTDWENAGNIVTLQGKIRNSLDTFFLRPNSGLPFHK